MMTSEGNRKIIVIERTGDAGLEHQPAAAGTIVRDELRDAATILQSDRELWPETMLPPRPLCSATRLKLRHLYGFYGRRVRECAQDQRDTTGRLKSCSQSCAAEENLRVHAAQLQEEAATVALEWAAAVERVIAIDSPDKSRPPASHLDGKNIAPVQVNGERWFCASLRDGAGLPTEGEHGRLLGPLRRTTKEARDDLRHMRGHLRKRKRPHSEAELPTVQGNATDATDSGSGKLEPGVQVFLTRLQATGFLNGALGTCQRFDSGKGRWVVLLSDSQERNLKPENLVPVSAVLQQRGVPVFISGLVGASHLNGTLGSCMHFSVERSRWIVHFDTGEDKGIKIENILPMSIGLQLGSSVYLKGLQTASQLNGTLATCQQVNTIKGSLAVRLNETGEEKSLKIDNLIPACIALQPGTDVRLKGVGVCAMSGTCQRMDGNTGEWVVRVEGGGEESFKPQDMIPCFLDS